MEEEENLGSAKRHTVTVRKVRQLGDMPPFLGVVHRHFEKARPEIPAALKEVSLNAPLDMMDFLLPNALLAGVESIEIIYKRSAP